MSDRILVPVDGSEGSTDALDYAIETFPNASITVLHAVEVGRGDIGAFSGMTGDLPDDAPERERAQELLDTARRRGAERGVEIETEVARGRPDRAIVKRADEENYDLVVIGSHGREGVARVLLGSVAEKVVRRSPIPVLVAR
ncbi:universal stress protein [Halobacteria archaeon AArc-dxtr1]|nr:universal stress protein [Halobacteria archaeon AArc-dxtr1]